MTFAMVESASLNFFIVSWSVVSIRGKFSSRRNVSISFSESVVSLVLSVCSFGLLLPHGFFCFRASFVFVFVFDVVGVGSVVFVGSVGNSCFVSVKVGLVFVVLFAVLSRFSFAFRRFVSVSL
jgi:hypothetical protein